MAKQVWYVLAVFVACTYIVAATNIDRKSRERREVTLKEAIDNVTMSTTVMSSSTPTTTVTTSSSTEGMSFTSMGMSNGTTACGKHCGKPSAAKTGLIVGIVVAALVGLLVVVIVVIKCHKKRQAAKKSEETGAEGEPLNE